jgi:4-hydroxy-tetrahydrodipicolinate synthase
MLTPFDERNEIDWRSLERLVDWYLASGVHGLFAICQSSEMFFLSDAESVKLARHIVAAGTFATANCRSCETGNYYGSHSRARCGRW